MNKSSIHFEGDTWSLLSLGAVRGDEVFAHLASQTRYRHHANGQCPAQIATWIPSCKAAEALNVDRLEALACGQNYRAFQIENEIERISTEG